MNKEPILGSSKFDCPHCRAVAQQEWFSLNLAANQVNRVINHQYFKHRPKLKDYHQEPVESFISKISNELEVVLGTFIPEKFSIATCGLCSDITLWVDESLIYPRKTSLPQANEDMNDDIKQLYQEAATIFLDSPKGATALLRLALQKLLKQVGESGENINNDIKELVSKGLSPKIQQALDILRVVGNNAVHPGQIDIYDNSEIALKLFNILNFIADEMITKPKELENLYADIIPENTKEHIKQRDGK